MDTLYWVSISNISIQFTSLSFYCTIAVNVLYEHFWVIVIKENFFNFRGALCTREPVLSEAM